MEFKVEQSGGGKSFVINHPTTEYPTGNMTLSEQFLEKKFGFVFKREYRFELFRQSIQYRLFDTMGLTNAFFIFETLSDAEKSLTLLHEFIKNKGSDQE